MLHDLAREALPSLVKRPQARVPPRNKLGQAVGNNDLARGQPQSGALHDLASEALSSPVKWPRARVPPRNKPDRLLVVMTRLGDSLDRARSMIWPVKPFILLLNGLRQKFLL
jgi:hypothetical protein